MKSRPSNDAVAGIVVVFLVALGHFLAAFSLQLALTAMVAGCAGKPEFSKDTFSVIGVNPPGGTIPADAILEVTFSRQIRSDSVSGCSVMLVREEAVGEAAAIFAKEVPEGADAEKAECAGEGVEVDGNKIRFSPEHRLEPGRKYRLAAAASIRDVRGYKLGGGDAAPFVGGDPYNVSLEGFNPSGDPAITELLANPAGDEAVAEFVEIFNPGPDTVEMEFWRLVSKPGFEQMISGCGRPTSIKPGEYGLIAGSPLAFSGLGREVAAGCVRGRIAGKGLLNTAGQSLGLVSPDGRQVSTYGGWRSSSEEGRSIERMAPGAPDEESSWIVSTVPGGTPGAPCEKLGDPGPARLLRFDPNGTEVGTMARFTLLFDRRVTCGKADGCVKICPDEQCCASGRGGASGETLQGSVEEVAEFTPLEVLAPLTGYRLAVSGFRDSGTGAAAGAYCMPFATGAGQDSTPPKARLSYPVDGAREVPANVSLVTLEFQEPVRLYGDGAVAIISNGKSKGLDCTSGRGALEWTCDIKGELECGTEKLVAVAGAVADLQGNLDGQGLIGRFWTSCDYDTSAPDVELSVASMAPLGFTARWTASEPCLFLWRLVELSSGAVVDEGTSARVTAEWVAGYDIPLSGGDYVLEGGCVDPAGNRGGPVTAEVLHGDLPPPVALNEVMANPSGSDTGAEFVELFNYGTEPVDLRGWRIGRCSESTKALELAPGAGFALSPGQYALVVSDIDKGSSYPWDAILLRLPGGPIQGGLSNSHPEEICLFDSRGGVVSSFGGWLVPGEGVTSERISADRPDRPDNWAASSQKGGTPGTVNSIKS